MKLWAYSILMLICFHSPFVNSATPTATQLNMSKHIETSIEWTEQLLEEVAKGTKSNAKEIEGHIAGILSFLSAMKVTSEQIVVESPSEKNEGHFTEMRRFQEAATLAAQGFPMAKSGKNPNFSAMKTASREILKNLESARHWHDLELSEIEKNPKD